MRKGCYLDSPGGLLWVITDRPALPGGDGKVELFFVSVTFQLPSAQNNPYVKVASFGVTCSDPPSVLSRKFRKYTKLSQKKREKSHHPEIFAITALLPAHNLICIFSYFNPYIPIFKTFLRSYLRSFACYFSRSIATCLLKQ